jgi:integrase
VGFLDDPAPRGLRREQIEAIFAVIPRQQLRDRLLFRLIYETGLRVGEALGVHLEDLIRIKLSLPVRYPNAQ